MKKRLYVLIYFPFSFYSCEKTTNNCPDLIQGVSISDFSMDLYGVKNTYGESDLFTKLDSDIMSAADTVSYRPFFEMQNLGEKQIKCSGSFVRFQKSNFPEIFKPGTNKNLEPSHTKHANISHMVSGSHSILNVVNTNKPNKHTFPPLRL